MRLEFKLDKKEIIKFFAGGLVDSGFFKISQFILVIFYAILLYSVVILFHSYLYTGITIVVEVIGYIFSKDVSLIVYQIKYTRIFNKEKYAHLFNKQTVEIIDNTLILINSRGERKIGNTFIKELNYIGSYIKIKLINGSYILIPIGVFKTIDEKDIFINRLRNISGKEVLRKSPISLFR